MLKRSGWNTIAEGQWAALRCGISKWGRELSLTLIIFLHILSDIEIDALLDWLCSLSRWNSVACSRCAVDSDTRASYCCQFGAAKFSRVRWLDPTGRKTNILTSSYDSRNNEIVSWSMSEGILTLHALLFALHLHFFNGFIKCAGCGSKPDSFSKDIYYIGIDSLQSALM